MSTENESKLEHSESSTPAGAQAPMDAALAAMGMEFDPLHFHSATVDGEAKPEGSASACPYARFFSGLFGGDKG